MAHRSFLRPPAGSEGLYGIYSYPWKDAWLLLAMSAQGPGRSSVVTWDFSLWSESHGLSPRAVHTSKGRALPTVAGTAGHPRISRSARGSDSLPDGMGPGRGMRVGQAKGFDLGRIPRLEPDGDLGHLSPLQGTFGSRCLSSSGGMVHSLTACDQTRETFVQAFERIRAINF